MSYNNGKGSNNKRGSKNGSYTRSKNGSATGSKVSGVKSNASSQSFYKDLFSNGGDMMKSSNSFPFAGVVGIPDRNRTSALNKYPVGETDNFKLPSIMVIESILAPGFSEDNSSSLNVAANKMFAEMRRYNTSVEVYDAVDVMQYILACDMAFAIHAYFKSAYAMLNYVDWVNRATPRAVCTARGFDYDDLMIHQTQLRDALNSFRNQLMALNVPSAFDFIRYHSNAYSTIYKDADNIRAQFYSIIPNVYYTFEEGLEASEPGKLVPHPFTSDPTGVRKLTVEDISRILKEIITPLMTSGSISLISGDMLKLTDYPMYTLDEVTSDTVYGPIYDPDFLRDLKNATIYMNTAPVTNHNVPHSTYREDCNAYCIEQSKDVGGIIFQPIVTGLTLGGDMAIDIDEDLPTPESIYAATSHTVSAVDVVEETDQENTYLLQHAVGNPRIMRFDYFVSCSIWEYDQIKNTGYKVGFDYSDEVPGVNVLHVKTKTFKSDITTDLVFDYKVDDTALLPEVMVDKVNHLNAMISYLNKFSVTPRIYLLTRYAHKSTGTNMPVHFNGILGDVYNVSWIKPAAFEDAITATMQTAYRLTK